MNSRWMIFSLLLAISWVTASGDLAAQNRRQASPSVQLERQVESAISSYRTGRAAARATWLTTTRLNQHFAAMNRKTQVRLRQIQATLALREGYPLLATIYATESILISGQAFHQGNSTMWRLLNEISQQHPVQFILEDFAQNLLEEEQLPPSFGNDWHYIVGNTYWEAGKNELAAKHYEKLTMQDRYYMPAQYHLGVIRFIQGDHREAEARLNAILDPSSRAVTPVGTHDRKDMSNYTYMALGRIYYEQRQFIRSAQHYRRVARDSHLFYNALFEQSWALFMGGSAKHALGSLYGVHSPYFAERYNPESKVLESMIYFWMCRYDQSRNALADFAEQHGEAVDSLGRFLDRQRLTTETAYQLFENLVVGVSSESIAIPRKVLQMAASSDTMLLVRDQYATLIEEISRLRSRGFFGSTDHLEPQERRLQAINENMRNLIGEKFLAELRSLKKHYDDLYEQSQFLYLELLMSQKEHLLGRELHADSRVRSAAAKDGISGWSFDTQSWEDDKNEFWWDEISFQIIDVDSECH